VRVSVATGAVGGSAATSFGVTVAPPTNGHTLIAVIATRGNTANRVASISQAGANWVRAAQGVNANNTTTEIWYASGVSNAVGTVTINLAASLFAAAVVTEYDGVLAVSPLDVTASNTGNSSGATTGATPTTTQANELWIGGIGLVNSGHTLSGVLNAFSAIGHAQSSSGTAGNNAKVYALERIATAAGSASSGGTLSTSAQWSGAMATFKAVLPSGLPLTLFGLAAENYSLGDPAGTFAITTVPLTITATNVSKTYGQSDPAMGVTYGEFVNEEGPGVLSGTLAVNRAAGENVGGYAITASGLSAINYAINYVAGTLTISPAALSVTAQNANKVYDGVAYSGGNGVSYAGFVGSENESVLTGTLTYGGSSQGAVNVGSYGITPGGLSSANYDITFNGGTLTIGPAALGVVADDKTRAYGAMNPELTASFVGLVNGEGPNVLSGTLGLSTSATTNSPVGEYAIAVGGLSATNYAISYTNGTLTVLPQGLTITATNVNKTYGQSDPALGVTYSGFVNGDGPGVLSGTLEVNRAAGENVGGYAITASGLSSTNYAINYVAGTLTISPAALSVTADDKSRPYGAANPELTASFVGFVSGEDTNVLSGALALSTSATTNSPVGEYAIAVSGLSATNYTIAYTNGTLTIAPAALSVTAQNVSKAYDGVAYSGGNGVAYAGFVGSEDASVLAGTLTYGGSSQGAINAGSYSITPGGLSSGNYNISFVNGTLTITSALLTVAADMQSKTYGDADPELTYQVTSGALAGGDSFTGGLVRAPGEAVGVYGIGLGTLSAGGNYLLTYFGANLTINPALLTVTAQDKIRFHGSENPELTVSYTGFKNGETSSVLTGSPELETTANVSSPAGQYPITVTAGSLSAANYSFNFVAGQLTVVNVPNISITPSNTSMILTMPGIPGQTYLVRGSSNLVDWITLDTSIAETNGTMIYTDTSATNHPARYYRIEVP
jgi:hypothetical protein